MIAAIEVAKQRHRQRCAQGKTTDAQGGVQQRRGRCPGKGGAKKAARAYTSDFYAGPVVPQGARRGSQYQVEEPRDGAAAPVPGGGAIFFTPPQRCAKARCPETRPRLPRLWLCVAHQHRQCSTCAAVGRGVRHCCARHHAGHPPPPPHDVA